MEVWRGVSAMRTRRNGVAVVGQSKKYKSRQWLFFEQIVISIAL